jgi:hypothetical protein
MSAQTLDFLLTMRTWFRMIGREPGLYRLHATHAVIAGPAMRGLMPDAVVFRKASA